MKFKHLVIEEYWLHELGLSKYAKVFFPNGYGASVICGPGTYGHKEGLWELAVLKGTKEAYKLCYDTKITNNWNNGYCGTIGWLTEKKVSKLLKDIEKL